MTGPAASIFPRVGILALLLSASCSAAPVRATDAANAMVTYWLDEEAAVHNACADVGAVPSLDTAGALANLAQNPSVRTQELRLEVTRNLGALLQTFETVGCTADEVLLSGVTTNVPLVKQPCFTAVQSSIFDRSYKDERSDIQQALRKSGVSDAATFLRDPVRTARLIDLSPAVISAYTSFARNAEGLVDTVANSISIPLVGTVARALARELVAEAMAAGLDLLLDKMERGKLVSRVAVSRSACSVYRAAQHSAGVVAVRGLKRAILRFHSDVAAVYAPRRACLDASIAETGLCPEILQRAGATTVDSGTSLPPPNLTADAKPSDATEAAMSLRRAARYCPHAPDAKLNVSNIDTAAGGTAKTEEEHGGLSCTFEFLNRAQSVFDLYHLPASVPSGDLQSYLITVDANLAAIGATQERLRSDIANMRGAVAGLSAATKSEAEELLNTQRKSLSLLLSLTACRDAEAQARKKRTQKAQKLGFGDVHGPVADDVCGIKGSSTTFTRVYGGATLTLSKEVLCNPFAAMEISVVTDGAFGSCSAAPNDQVAEIIKTLGKSLCELVDESSLKVTGPAIVVEGHTDQVPLGPKCKAATNLVSNEELSGGRAETVASLLSLGLQAGGCGAGALSKRSLGESRLLETNCGSDDTCNSKNRRVNIQLIDGLGATLNSDACGAKSK